MNGCYASHVIIHSGTHVVKIPDHLEDRIASPINCALATMINAVSGISGKNQDRETIAVIQVIFWAVIEQNNNIIIAIILKNQENNG